MHEKKEIWRLPVQQLAASALASRDFPEATRIVVPVVVLYTLLKIRQDLPPVLYEPVTCKPPCRAILNPYWWETKSVFITTFNLLLDSQIDICGKLWISPFCLFHNSFPKISLIPTCRLNFFQNTPPSNTLRDVTMMQQMATIANAVSPDDKKVCVFIYIYINFFFFFGIYYVDIISSY